MLVQSRDGLRFGWERMWVGEGGCVVYGRYMKCPADRLIPCNADVVGDEYDTGKSVPL